MLQGVHFLLTYSCTFECDHCFLYCKPGAPGTFTLRQLRKIIGDLKKMKSVTTVYFEGGEPSLYYPLMIEGIRLARAAGKRAGVVTNAYWATCVEDAQLWLSPLKELSISDLSLSDDAFHQGDDEVNTAKVALKAARRLGLPVATICIDAPTVEPGDPDSHTKGAPVVGGGVLFKGRAVDKLTADLPTRPLAEFIECPHEDLADPSRVHVDCYGHVQVCQGVSIGNLWKTPLSRLMPAYDASRHPICGPLLKGGPALLAKEYDLPRDGCFVDHCHACFTLRKMLIDRFPDCLAPRQVYGLE